MRISDWSSDVCSSDLRIDGDGWSVDGLALSLPRFHPDQRVRGHADGRVTLGERAVRFDLTVAMTRPANDAGIAIDGPLTASSGSCRLPARLHLSAPLHFGDDDPSSTPLHAHLTRSHESGTKHTPFPHPLHPPPLL